MNCFVSTDSHLYFSKGRYLAPWKVNKEVKFNFFEGNQIDLEIVSYHLNFFQLIRQVPRNTTGMTWYRFTKAVSFCVVTVYMRICKYERICALIKPWTWRKYRLCEKIISCCRILSEIGWAWGVVSCCLKFLKIKLDEVTCVLCDGLISTDNDISFCLLRSLAWIEALDKKLFPKWDISLDRELLTRKSRLNWYQIVLGIHRVCSWKDDIGVRPGCLQRWVRKSVEIHRCAVCSVSNCFTGCKAWSWICVKVRYFVETWSARILVFTNDDV